MCKDDPFEFLQHGSIWFHLVISGKLKENLFKDVEKELFWSEEQNWQWGLSGIVLRNLRLPIP